jgi:hypothetical protein
MLSLSLLTIVLGTADFTSRVDYSAAFKRAAREHKDLVIYFREDDHLDDVLRHPDVRERLAGYVFLQVPADYQLRGETLLQHPCLEEMGGRPGLAVISLHDRGLPFYQEVVSAHPFMRSHYGWVPDYGLEEVKAILDLPAHATLTQRSMIYAIRVHPEVPQSVYGEPHPAFLAHAERHSARQAGMLNQHHADLIATSAWLSGELGQGLGGQSEVVAESWGRVVGGENVLEAAFSCVDAWRHSSGHWGAVSRPHRYFGYDLARGANGTWYATGIFADRRNRSRPAAPAPRTGVLGRVPPVGCYSPILSVK